MTELARTGAEEPPPPDQAEPKKTRKKRKPRQPKSEANVSLGECKLLVAIVDGMTVRVARAVLGDDCDEVIQEHIAMTEAERSQLAKAALPVAEKYADWIGPEVMLLGATVAIMGPKWALIGGAAKARRDLKVHKGG